MNLIRLKSARLRKLVLAQSCALIAVSLATGQQTNPDPVRAAQDAQALAKYDANKNGTLDASERATMAADQANASTPGAAGEGEVFLLTPFQVDASKDAGYFAENTLAGSRLNTNLSDLAASITVVTKQQMEDTASLDINDIFKYEASTEGSNTYTPQVLDRGTLKDTIGGYSFGNNGDTQINAQSNRVRGLAAPDASINYHPSNSRVPFDSYNTQSVEISRGPNSLLFGMGSPAGIVNQSASQAVLNRDSSTVSLRTDHMGSFRTSLALNRSVIKDKLAIYGAFLYNDQRFEREPARELTRRQYGAITAKPFPKTIIRAFAENYDNFANRPNFVTPRDMVTPWLQAGRPAYDSVTRMITRSNGAPAVGPFYFDTRSPGANSAIRQGTTQLTGGALLTNTNSPYFIPFGINFDTGNSSPLERFDNGRQIDYFQRTVTFYAPAHTNPATATPNNSSWAANDPRFLISDRNWTSSTTGLSPTAVINGVTYTYSSYQAPGVTNGAIYDWSKINVNEPNFGQLKAGNYNIEIEQQIFDSLFFSAGWFRQDIDSSENYILSQLQGNTMQIDTNLRTMDGRTNPYFGLPFLPLGLGGGIDTFFAPETDDSYRALLAWDVDFTKQKNIFKWLGRHRFLGLLSEQSVKRVRERWRLGWVDGDAEGKLRYTRNLTLDGQSHWNGTTIRKAYYLASPGDAQAIATHSAGYYGNPGSNPQQPYVARINAYNFNTNDFHNSTVSERIAFADNGSARFQREVQSWNLAAQSYLWNDRLVTTIGIRHDKYRARNTTVGNIVNPAGVQIEPSLTANQIYPFKSGDADYNLVMNRWIPWDKLDGDTKTLGAAFRPFKGWNFVESRATNGSIVGDFLRGLTFYYNESDNFNPPPGSQTDYFKKKLPKPTGDGRDGGFGFNLFNNKLVARVNWFETANQNERTNAATTLLTRLAYSDTTTGLPWASTVQRIRNGMAAGQTLAQITSTTDWNTNNVWDISDAANQQKIYDLIKLPLNYYSGLQLAATQESVAKGVEVQITYNPSRNWTMKFTGTKSKSTYTDVAPQYDEWLAARLPIWQTNGVTDIPDFASSAEGGRQYSLRNFWTGYGFSPQARIENLDGNTSPQAYFNNVVQSEVALAKALQGAVAPNQRIYHANFLTNYVFNSGKLKGFSVGGSERWESKAAVGFYGKAANPLLPTVINASDITRPVYLENGNFYTDLWIAYNRKIWNDKIRMKIQLNVNNVTEDGHLQPVAVNWDGQPWGFRIVDPRSFVLTTTFDF